MRIVHALTRSAGSLTSRIFLTVFLALIVPPFINTIFFIGLPNQEVYIFSTKWIVDRTVQAVRLVDLLPPGERLPALGVLPLSPQLQVSITTDFDASGQEPDNTFDGFNVILRTELMRRLQSGARDVVVISTQPLSQFPFPMVRLRFYPIERNASSSKPDYESLSLTKGDVPIPSTFIIGVRLRDGSWLSIRPTPTVSNWSRALQIFGVVMTTLVLLSAIVYLASRSLIRPLTSLKTAVENFGEEYVAEPVPAVGIAEYDRIAAKFNQLQIQIATYLRERTQMIGAISHDLRTPLTRLRLFSEYLPDEDIKKNAIASIDEMHLMIEDTLSYAQGLMSQEQRSTADIAVMLMTEADAQTDLGHHVDYNGPSHAPLLCHPVALKRAFSNLIENGIKYGNAVAVRLSTNDREVMISIVDQGEGIPPDKLTIALAPFERLEGSRNRETGGAGLGLTIARDVVARHGGSLSFKQLGSKGFEARVILPQLMSDAPPS
jgi:signal transduction histidine kinase